MKPNRARPSLRQLEYFVAVADSGSFRRAAERLGISQPTLTGQIATLERALGGQLFERSRTGTKQSPLGRALLRDARLVLEQVESIADNARSLTGAPAGTYRLGVTRTLGPYLLPHILPDLHRRYSALRFYVREDVPRDLEEKLTAGVHDLVLTTLPVASKELTVVPLFKERLQLVMPLEHRLGRKARVNGQDLVGEEVLTIEESYSLHGQIQQLCERFGATVRRDYEGTSLDTLRQMVVMGMGVSFLPALYVRSEIRDGDGLRVAAFGSDAMVRENVLVWRSGSPARASFRALADDMRSIVKSRLGKDVITGR